MKIEKESPANKNEIVIAAERMKSSRKISEDCDCIAAPISISHSSLRKQAENGLQSRSSENGNQGLSWSNKDYQGLSWIVMDYHGLSWTVIDYHRLLKIADISCFYILVTD